VAFFAPVVINNTQQKLLFMGTLSSRSRPTADGRHLFGTGKPVDGGVNSILYPPEFDSHQMGGL